MDQPVQGRDQQRLANPLATALLEGQYQEGGTVTVDVALDGTELTLR